MTVLKLENIHYSYSGHIKPALDGASVQFEQGERIVLIGRNGSGKSTLILHANGILKPQQGRVILNGKPVQYDRKSLLHLRRNVGVVFQNPEEQLFSASIIQDMSMGPLNMGYSESETRALVMETADLCGLSKLLDRPTHALSGGEKTLAALAGVLVLKPHFLFADEVTNSLDPWIRVQVMNVLNRLVSFGSTVVLATHDLGLACHWAERMIWMENGRIAGDGPPSEILSAINPPGMENILCA